MTCNRCDNTLIEGSCPIHGPVTPEHKPQPLEPRNTFSACKVCGDVVTRIKLGKQTAPNHLGPWRHTAGDR